jgi:hypothetical protein
MVDFGNIRENIKEVETWRMKYAVIYTKIELKKLLQSWRVIACAWKAL